MKELAQYEAGLPIGNIESYISWANQIPLLDESEELRLAHLLFDEGDVDAARQLILPHLRLVVKIARGYLGYGLPLGDLVQEGNIGLMKAVKRFDPHVGVRLASFAVHWIRSEIHEFVLKNWRIVKVATTKDQRKLFFNLRKSSKKMGWFTDEEVLAVADQLQVKASEVRNMELRLRAIDAPYDSGAEDSGGEDSAQYLPKPMEYLADTQMDPALLVENDDLENSRLDALHRALHCLDSRSREIIGARWLDKNKQTLAELASRYNISLERVRQIEKQALKKLYEHLND